LAAVGIVVPFPVRVEVGSQVAVVHREGTRLEVKAEPTNGTKKRAPRTAVNAPLPAPATAAPNGAGMGVNVFNRREQSLVEQVAADPAAVVAQLGEAPPPSFP